MRFAAILALLLAISSAAAQEPLTVLDLTNAKPGAYMLTIDAAGGISMRPLRVIPFGKPSQPNPPPPSDLKPFEQAISKLTKQALDNGGSKTTGAGLASVYSLVSAGVADGSIALDKTWDAIKKASDAVIAIQGDGVKWSAFRDELGKALTQLSTDGSLTTKAQVAAALQSIANGMNDATGFSGNPAEVAKLDPATAGVLDGIDLAKLIELIKLVMELLKLFGA